MAKAKTNTKAPSKTEILTNIAEATELSKKQVQEVLDALAEEIRSALSKKGPEQFTIPGLCKIAVKHVDAKPAGMRRNPFTGEEKMQPAQPASRKVTVRPLKALKDMVS